jgi:small-conductance mechanosensitive channel
MNPVFLTLCASLQVAILYVTAEWMTGVAFSTALVAVLAMFAFTREHWDAHLDMVLLMVAPGGLGMMLAMLLPYLGMGPACHAQRTWTSYWVMTAGMLFVSVPLCWKYARCIQQARRDGYGGRALLLDLLGMQAGMTLAHLPVTLLPMTDPRSVWLHHGVMLSGMLLGMLPSMLVLRFWLGRETRQRANLVSG